MCVMIAAEEELVNFKEFIGEVRGERRKRDYVNTVLVHEIVKIFKLNEN